MGGAVTTVVSAAGVRMVMRPVWLCGSELAEEEEASKAMVSPPPAAPIGEPEEDEEEVVRSRAPSTSWG